MHADILMALRISVVPNRCGMISLASKRNVAANKTTRIKMGKVNSPCRQKGKARQRNSTSVMVFDMILVVTSMNNKRCG